MRAIGRFPAKLLLLAVPPLVIGALAGALVVFAGSDASHPEAAALPTACENFSEAAEQLVSHGEASIAATGHLFRDDAQSRRFETVSALLEACRTDLAPAASAGP